MSVDRNCTQEGLAILAPLNGTSNGEVDRDLYVYPTQNDRLNKNPS